MPESHINAKKPLSHVGYIMTQCMFIFMIISSFVKISLTREFIICMMQIVANGLCMIIRDSKHVPNFQYCCKGSSLTN